MKRPRMRSIVCGSVAGACLCGGLFVYAGPMSFVSRVWKERPVILKAGESRLNPINWFRGSDEDGTKEEPVAQIRQKVERPELVSDPFLADPVLIDDLGNEIAGDAPRAEPEMTVARPYHEPGDQSPGERAPLAVERNVAETQAAANSEAETLPMQESMRPRRPVQPTASGPQTIAGPVQRAPRLPDVSGFSPASTEPDIQAARPSAPQKESAPALPVGRPVAATKTNLKQRPTAPTAGTNQFVGGFDAEFSRLVQSVIVETKPGTVSAPVPRLPEDSAVRQPSASPPPGFADQQQLGFGTAETEADFLPLMPPRTNQENNSVANRTPAVTPSKSGEYSTEDELREFARYGRKLTGQSIDEVIQDSRDRLAGTPLATMRRNPGDSQLTGGQDTGSQVRQIESSGMADDSNRERELEMLQAPMMQITPRRAGSGVIVSSRQSRPVRPRVTSNGAPRRSVPNNSGVERLSYQTDEILADGSLGQPGEGPMLLPPEDGANGQQFFERADDHAASLAAADEATMPPIKFQFPTETEAAPSESSSGIGWFIAVICLMLAVGIGGYLARKKLRIDSIDLTRIRPRFEKE